MGHLFRSSGYEQIGDPQYQILNSGNQDGTSFVVYGYTSNKVKSFVYHMIGTLLVGIPYMLCSWYPNLKILKYDKSPLRCCSVVFVTDNHESSRIARVRKRAVRIPNFGLTTFRYFYYQHTEYIWIPQKEAFDTIEECVQKSKVDDYLNDLQGLSDIDYNDLRDLYGENKIEVEIKSYWKLFKEEVFNPFYIFQVCSMLLWCFDDYMIYAGCVFILTAFSVITALIQTRKQSISLHNLIEKSKCHKVTVIRHNVQSEIYQTVVDPNELVPGDLIVIPSSSNIMPCDAVILTGQCIVNESMLTGESVPVTKTSPHSCSEIYDPIKHKRYTLFSGTLVIQTRNYSGDSVVARVVRTGFNTTKGALVKSILYPTPINLKFYRDSFKFVFVLFILAVMGMSYCLYLYVKRHAPIKEIIIRSLDIITIVVPPALPAAMTVGIVYSQNRLKKIGIFSISPQRINVCGKVKLACFDKTGTLTNDGLDMHVVIPSINSTFAEAITDISSLDVTSRLVQAMACCHSLTRIDGQINGDPLDLNMFDFTNWDLEEPGNKENARFDMLAPTVVKPNGLPETRGAGDVIDLEIPYEIGIIRQFPFSSTMQCMSVICRELRKPNMVAFVKGAPEKIMGMCLLDTVPNNFSTTLAYFTTRGYRVIAIAYKELSKKFKVVEAQRVKREVIECDLIFLGLMIMQNTLKSQTVSVIDTLHFANIRTVMITGDNVLTAISVARECHMVKSSDDVFLLQAEHCDNQESIPKISIENIGMAHLPNENVIVDLQKTSYHFALDGKTWDYLKIYYADILPDVLVRATVFARFQPDQKTQLIKHLQELDYIVSMVGDGANDCGALKAAHVGVSLSQLEASVAAPFTSSVADISCIIHLILEGRCALVTSFAVFKYMALYSIIQFFTILILYKNHSILGDAQFLFIDLIITTTMAVTIGRQGPSKILCKERPLASLVSLKNLIPITLQVFICGLTQAAALYYLFQQKWFKPAPHTHDEVILCWENTVLFTVSCFQYVVLALVYSKGRPHRQPLITNYLLLLNALILIGFTAWLMVYPSKGVAEFFELKYSERFTESQHIFHYILVAFPAVHFLMAVFIEVCIAERQWLKSFVHFLSRKKHPRNKYKMLLKRNNLFYRLFTQSNV